MAINETWCYPSDAQIESHLSPLFSCSTFGVKSATQLCDIQMRDNNCITAPDRQTDETGRAGWSKQGSNKQPAAVYLTRSYGNEIQKYVIKLRIMYSMRIIFI